MELRLRVARRVDQALDVSARAQHELGLAAERARRVDSTPFHGVM